MASLAPVDGGRALDAVAWLEESWSEPATFFQQLHRWHLESTGLSSVSTPGGQIGLYHDLIRRHIVSDRIAFTRYDDSLRSWEAFSYKDLDAAAQRLASHWSSQGLAAGQSLALALPMGKLLLIAYATALRLGLVVSLIPPDGPALLSARLAALAPDAVATSYRFEQSLAGFEGLLLLADARYQGRGEGWRGEHSYGAEDLVARLFSPLRSDGAKPLELMAGQAYLAALRDRVFTLNVGPGDLVCAPGADLTQHQPALLNACLISGATWMHLTLAQLKTQPTLLEGPKSAGRLAAMVLSRQTRDTLTPPPKLSRWRRWLRNPSEALEWDAWRDFVDAAELGERPCVNALFEAASGGAILISAARKQAWAINPYVLPPPARPWALADLGGAAQSLSGAGVFIPEGDDDDPPGEVVLASRGGEFFLAGQRSPRRDGRTYPSVHVIAAVEGLPGLEGATVLPVLVGETPYLGRFIVLAFCGSDADAAEALPAQVNARVSERVSPAWLPDQVRVYSLYPREVDGETDHDWCRAQLLSGALDRKSRLPAFTLLTEARAAFDALGPSMHAGG